MQSQDRLAPDVLVSIFNDKNYVLNERDFELNIIGVRSESHEAGAFDDLLILLRKVDGAWESDAFEVTVDAGSRYLARPINRAGTAGICPGQHPKAWEVDIHNGWVRTLCQRREKIRVFRDNNRDNRLDYHDGSIQLGMFGINFHPDGAEPDGKSGKNVSASAGCQVFRYASDHREFMRWVDQHNQIYGDGHGYTVLEERDFEGWVPGGAMDELPAESETATVVGTSSAIANVPVEIAAWAQWIVDMEGRRDANGNLLVYRLPSGDGGGAYEVAGINERYHPAMAKELKRLIEGGAPAAAEDAAMAYIVEYTSAAQGWHPDPRVGAFLKDCAFNRGPTGAAKILQIALKTAGTYTGPRDGKVGDGTRGAAAKHAAEDLIFRLVLARQTYERTIVKRSESSKFWNGLVNRWVNAAQIALSIGDPDKDLF